jgi:hypothetical protein
MLSGGGSVRRRRHAPLGSMRPVLVDTLGSPSGAQISDLLPEPKVLEHCRRYILAEAS